MCNEKGLFCLDDDDTGLALLASVSSISFLPYDLPYLLSVDVVVVCIQCQVLLASNMETVDLDFLGCRAIFE